MFKNSDRSDPNNERLTGGSGYKGPLQISYKEIAEVLGEIGEYAEEWEGFLWNGLFFNIYPANHNKIWSLDELKKNKRWHVGGTKNLVYTLVAFMVGHLLEHTVIDIIFRRTYENP